MLLLRWHLVVLATLPTTHFEDCYCTDGHQEDDYLNHGQGVIKTLGAHKEASTTNHDQPEENLEAELTYLDAPADVLSSMDVEVGTSIETEKQEQLRGIW